MPDMPGSSAFDMGGHFDGCIAFLPESSNAVSRPGGGGEDARADDEHSYRGGGGGSILHFDGARYRVGRILRAPTPARPPTAAVGR